MARPQSRSGMPGTASRQGAGYRPSVRAGTGMRPPSGMRMGTATGNVTSNISAGMTSVGLSTSVLVENRPETRTGGLTGMSTQALGPGRQIADDRYYINELRTRIKDITDEMAALRQEVEDIETGNQLYTQYERQYEVTIKEVRHLEGQLADFNLALDKLRTNTDVQDIKDAAENTRRFNDSERKRVDEIFMETQGKTNQTKETEKQIEQVYADVAQRMESLGPDARNEYEELQQEMRMLQQEIYEKESKVADLDMKTAHLSHTLQSPEYQTHQRGIELSKERKALLARKMVLEEETDESQTPEQIREKLLQKVKDANADIEVLTRRIKATGEIVERIQDEVREKEEELANVSKHSQKAKKYEAVYERDRKMQDFIDTFDQAYEDDKKLKANLKSTIVALLKHISKGLHASDNMPDAEALSDMKRELSFKEQKLANSQDTLKALEEDLVQRKAELEKINSLDKKITVELTSLRGKIQQMTHDQANFKGEDELREEANQAKKELLREKQRTKKVRDSIKQQVQLLGHAYEKRKRELDGNETMKRVDGLEQKLRTYSQTVYQLQEYIMGRKRESDYQGACKLVLETAAKINRNLIEQINAK